MGAYDNKKKTAADVWNEKYDPFGLKKNQTQTTSNYNAAAGYMGNTLEMQNALAKNNIAMQNNGQKTAVASTSNPLADMPRAYYSYGFTDNDEDESPKTTVNADKNKTASNTGGYSPTSAYFAPSESYQKAMAVTNSLLEQLTSGRTSYTDRINALMDEISNREKFSYDFNTDPLFQQSLQSAMQKGSLAMQDTMGQAAALTGGYGSSYATSAANQAYNQSIQEAYDNLPDYYNMALNKYQNDSQDMYNRLSMLSNADEMEYSRLANAYAQNAANADSIYNKEYNNYWQSKNFDESSRQFASNQAYKYASLAAQKAENDRNFAENQRQFDAKLAADLLKSSGTESDGPTHNLKQADLKNLMDAYIEGDEDAFNNLYSSYSPSMTDDDVDYIEAWIEEYDKNHPGFLERMKQNAEKAKQRVSTSGKTNPYRN